MGQRRMRHGATHARRRVELTDEPTRRRHGAMHAERVEGARSAWGEQRITSPTHTQSFPLLPSVLRARARGAALASVFPLAAKKNMCDRLAGMIYYTASTRGLLLAEQFLLTSLSLFSHMPHRYATSPRVCRDINSRKPARGPPLLRRVLSMSQHKHDSCLETVTRHTHTARPQ